MKAPTPLVTGWGSRFVATPGELGAYEVNQLNMACPLRYAEKIVTPAKEGIQAVDFAGF
jgi:hypothetical protein